MNEKQTSCGTCEQSCPAWLTRKAVISNEATKEKRNIAQRIKRTLPLLAIRERMRLSLEIDQFNGEVSEREKYIGSMAIEDVIACPGPLTEAIYGEGELSEDILQLRKHCGAYLLSRGIVLEETGYQLPTSE
jgi:hypothetical protein